MSVCCVGCGRPKQRDTSSCPWCGSSSFYCTACGHLLQFSQISDVRCLVCEPDAIVVLPPGRAPVLATQVPQVPVVPEVYQAGRYGVSAEVRMPAGDVEILNRLGQLSQLLYSMATETGSGFRGVMDHTRQMVRDMRKLAADIQEEIEMRRGPVG